MVGADPARPGPGQSGSVAASQALTILRSWPRRGAASPSKASWEQGVGGEGQIPPVQLAAQSLLGTEEDSSTGEVGGDELEGRQWRCC